jgi:filamentous hemagglutinin family protein
MALQFSAGTRSAGVSQGDGGQGSAPNLQNAGAASAALTAALAQKSLQKSQSVITALTTAQKQAANAAKANPNNGQVNGKPVINGLQLSKPAVGNGQVAGLVPYYTAQNTAHSGSQVPTGTVPVPGTWGGVSGLSQSVTGNNAAAPDSATVTITQNQQSAYLYWSSFNVGAQTTLNFRQSGNLGTPGTWIAFNKVMGSSDPSHIFGQINSPGQVYILNQNGVLFHAGSEVNVQSLVAATLPINKNLAGDALDHVAANGLINNPGYQFLFSALNLTPSFAGRDAFTPNPTSANGSYTASQIGQVLVEPGASLTTSIATDNSGGKVILAGSSVINNGIISTPNGQAILAAGLQVGLMPHAQTSQTADPSLRGLDVYVGAISDLIGGTVDASGTAVGTIVNNGSVHISGGEVALVGKDVTMGGLNASTADASVPYVAWTPSQLAPSVPSSIEGITTVSLNGRVDLLAAYNAVVNGARASVPGYHYSTTSGRTTGSINIAPGSLIEVIPTLASDTTTGTQLALSSIIDITGGSVSIGEGALILAPGATGSADPTGAPYYDMTSVTQSKAFNAPITAPISDILSSGITISAGSFVPIASSGTERGYDYLDPASGTIMVSPGAIISAAGSAAVPVSSQQNFQTIQLRAAELANYPLENNKNNAIYGKNLVVDVRNSGTYNGQYWIGTPLGNVLGYVNLIQRTAQQLTVNGGSIAMTAGDSITLSQGAMVNVSGGYQQYAGGSYAESELITAQGVVVPMSKAMPDQIYTGIVKDPLLSYEAPYQQGGNGGRLSVSAQGINVSASLYGDVTVGPRQRMDTPKLSSTISLSSLPGASSLILNLQGDNLRSSYHPSLTISRGTPTDFTQVFLNPIVVADAGSSDGSSSGGGFGCLAIENHDGSISLPPTVSMALPDGSYNPYLNPSQNQYGGVASSDPLNVQGYQGRGVWFDAQNITIGGNISSPGGMISMTTHDFTYASLGNLSPNYSAIDPLHGNLMIGWWPNPQTRVLAPTHTILSTAGLVVVDSEGHLPDVTSGGQINLKGLNLNVSSSSELDVSGGVRFSTPSSKPSYGNAGLLSMSGGTDIDVITVRNGLFAFAGADLMGYAGVGASSGQISISAPAIQIGGAGVVSGGIGLDTTFFNAGGFASFSLSGSGEPIVTGPSSQQTAYSLSSLGVGTDYEIPGILVSSSIQSPTVISPEVANIQFSPADSSKTVFMMPQGERPATSLSLNATSLGSSDTANPYLLRGTVKIDGSATIVLNPSVAAPSSLNLTVPSVSTGVLNISGKIVEIGGRLVVPGGQILLSGASSHPDNYNDPSPRPTVAFPTLQIDPGTVVSTKGEEVHIPDPLGRAIGSVLPGGKISLSGNILIPDSSATLDVSGALGNIYANSVARGAFSHEAGNLSVGSSAGSIQLSGCQFLLTAGSLVGKAGASYAAGGSLTVGSGVFVYDISKLSSSQSASQNSLEVSQNAPVMALASLSGLLPVDGQNVSFDQAAHGYYGINSAVGFDSVTLNGNIAFDGNVTLNAPSAIILGNQGGVINASGMVNISAPYVAIGGNIAGIPDLLPSQLIGSGATPSYGTGILNVRASSIDVGDLLLKNIGSASLAATQVIRGDGTFSMAGNLALTANQVYPLSGKNLNLIAYNYDSFGSALPTGGTPGAITIGLPSSPASLPVPYSAGGSVALYANSISQGGVLLAPFGSITLGSSGGIGATTDPLSGISVPLANGLPDQNPNLSTPGVLMKAGSYTSVTSYIYDLNNLGGGLGQSALTLPYGALSSGQWFDPSGNSINLSGLPSKGISLAGDSISTKSGSFVDVRGGGDLASYEWISGNKGTIDPFSQPSSLWSPRAYNVGDKVSDNGVTYTATTSSAAAQPEPGLGQNWQLYWNPTQAAFAIIPISQFQGTSGKSPSLFPEATQSGGSLQGLVSVGSFSKTLPVSNILPGDEVYLSGGGNLAAGYYMLLPAGYAELGGAYLVTPETKPVDGQSGKVSLPNGSFRMGGIRFNGMNPNAKPIGIETYFTVMPPSLVGASAYVQSSVASKFLPNTVSANAVSHGGTLAISTTSALTLEGQALAQGLNSSDGATVEISGSQPFSIGSRSIEGSVLLDPSVLSSWNAGLLVIGGKIEFSPSGNSLTPQSSTIFVNNTASTPLVANDLILSVVSSPHDPSQTYITSAFDTPDSLASAFGLPLAQLQQENPSLLGSIPSTSSIGANQVVTLPSGILIGAGSSLSSVSSKYITTIADTPGTVATTLGVSVSDLRLANPDLLGTMAKGQEIGSGATLNVPGIAPAISLSGEGVVLRLSCDPLASVSRIVPSDGFAGLGFIAIGDRANLSGGSITIDSSGSGLIFPSSTLSKGAINLTAAKIILGGQNSQEPEAFNISGTTLQVISSVGRLSLHSYSSINFNGPVQLGSAASSFVHLQAGELMGLSGDSASVNAASIVLDNPFGSSDPSIGNPAVGSGNQLALNASTDVDGNGGTVIFGSGGLSVGGFGGLGSHIADVASLSVVASTALLATGNSRNPGVLRVAGGIQIQVPLIEGQGNSVNAFLAGSDDGGASIATSWAAAASANPPTPGLGASISLSAPTVNLGGGVDFVLPSGSLAVIASGSVAQGNNLFRNLCVASQIDAGGRALSIQGAVKYTDAGSVSLSSASGSIDLTGAVINLAAQIGGGAAGSVSISAPMGQVFGSLGAIQATAPSGIAGKFTLDVAHLGGLGTGGDGGDVSATEGQLSADGFTSAQTIRIRSDSMVHVGNAQASSYTLSVDNGFIDISGKIDASGVTGGQIALYAGDSIMMNNPDARLDAHGAFFSHSGQGGQITLLAGGALGGGAPDAGASYVDPATGVFAPSLASVSLTQGEIDLYVGPSAAHPLTPSIGQTLGILTIEAPQTLDGTDLQVNPVGTSLKLNGASAIQLVGFNTINVLDPISGTKGTVGNASIDLLPTWGFTGTSPQMVAGLPGPVFSAYLPGQMVVSPSDGDVWMLSADVSTYSAYVSTAKSQFSSGFQSGSGPTDPGSTDYGGIALPGALSADGFWTLVAVNYNNYIQSGSIPQGAKVYYNQQGPIGGGLIYTATQNMNSPLQPQVGGSGWSLLPDEGNLQQIALNNASVFGGSYAGVTTRVFANQPGISPVSQVLPSENIQNSVGGLVLNADWDFSLQRYGPVLTVLNQNQQPVAYSGSGPIDANGNQGIGSVPGFLSLRARENISLFGSLSDGFGNSLQPAASINTDIYGNPALYLSPLLPLCKNGSGVLVSQNSWSYQIAAGNDFGSANPMVSSSHGAGNIFIGVPGLLSGTMQSSMGDPYLSDSVQGYYQPIRTGTGNISLTAGGSINLLNQFSSIYTAGAQITDPSLSGAFGIPSGAVYSSGGGNVSLVAGKNIAHVQALGDPNNFGTVETSFDGSTLWVSDTELQTPESWLPRRGSVTASGGWSSSLGIVNSTSWWIDFSNYFEGVATLGGGNVSMVAGGSIVNVDASTPTQARMTAMSQGIPLSPSMSTLIETGGGDISITTGNDLSGGVYYVERGTIVIHANGNITSNPARNVFGTYLNYLQSPNAPQNQAILAADGLGDTRLLPTLFLLGKGSINVECAGSALIGSVANPFLLVPGSETVENGPSYFSTYNQLLNGMGGMANLPDGSFSVESLSGNINWRTMTQGSPDVALLPFGNIQGFQPWAQPSGAYSSTQSTAAQILPSTVSMTAYSGGISLGGAILLNPSAVGNLSFASAGAFTGQYSYLDANGNNHVLESSIDVSDANPSLILGVLSPSIQTSREFANMSSIFSETGAYLGTGAPTLQQKLTLHDAMGILHNADDQPVQIISDGDVSGFQLFSPKETQVVAGGNINDISLYIQNVNPSDVSIVAAGGNITPYVGNQAGDIQISGPGTLEVAAGGNIDLGNGVANANGTSAGITSIGNQRNPLLPLGGADISVAAGITLAKVTDSMAGRNLINQMQLLPDAADYFGQLVFQAAGISLPSKDPAGNHLTDPGQQLRQGVENLVVEAIASGGISFSTLTSEMAQVPGNSSLVSLLNSAGSLASLNLRQLSISQLSSLAAALFNQNTALRIGGDNALCQAIFNANSLPGILALPTSSSHLVSLIQQNLFFLALRNSGRDNSNPNAPSYRKKFIDAKDVITAFLPNSGSSGNISMESRNIRTKSGGQISIFAPFGGVSMATVAASSSAAAAPPGIVTESGGLVDVYTGSDVSLGIGRIFTLRGGDIMIWSNLGNIAAGASAKTVATAPPTYARVDPTSADVLTDIGGLATGGGIGTLQAVLGIPAANIDLIAPTGYIDAGDAGIRSSGNLNLAATAILNAANIQVGGLSVGVPPPAASSAPAAAPAPAPAPASAPSSASTAAAAASSSADKAADKTAANQADETPSLISIDIMGYGGGDGDGGEGSDDQHKKAENSSSAPIQASL